MPFSVSYANEILDGLFGKEDIPVYEEIYIALSENDPEEDNGTFEELTCNTYHRVKLINNISGLNHMGHASGRMISNVRQINWDKATELWTEAKGFGIWNSQTGGQLLYYGKLDNPVTVTAEAVALFDPGTLKISFSDKDLEYTEE